jgi:sugar lactone lactonase YvrE
VPSRRSSACLALALGLAQSGKPGAEVPRYPWQILPLDAVYGHLAEGAFKEPLGVCFEPAARELFVADSRNGLIGIFDAERIPVFAFGGPSLLVEPRAVLADADGTIYVLDAAQTELHRFSYRGEPQAPLRFERPTRPQEGAEEGGTSAPAAEAVGLFRIGAFARAGQQGWCLVDLDERRLLVYDRELHFVRELRPSRTAGKFTTLSDVAVSARGLVAAVDMQGTPAVHVYDPRGELLAAFGERDVGLEDFTAPAAVAFDEQEFLYVADLLRHDVKVYTARGEFVAHFGGWFSPETRGRAPGELLYPMDIAIDPKGPIYVAERFGQRVQAFDRVLLPPASDARPRTPGR